MKKIKFINFNVIKKHLVYAIKLKIVKKINFKLYSE